MSVLPLGLINAAFLTGLNAMLAQQKPLKALLFPHVGKSALFEWTLTGFQIAFVVGEAGVLYAQAQDSIAQPDVTLVFNGGYPVPPVSMNLIRQDLRIDGNADFAEALSQVIQALEFRPGDWIQPFLGDVLTFRLERLAQAAATEFSRLFPVVQSKTCSFLREKREVSL